MSMDGQGTKCRRNIAVSSRSLKIMQHEYFLYLTASSQWDNVFSSGMQGSIANLTV